MTKGRKTGGTKVIRAHKPRASKKSRGQYRRIEKRHGSLTGGVREKTVNVRDTVKPATGSGSEGGGKSGE